MLMKSITGGLIQHFYHDPIPLELMMDYLIFTFVDNSNEKLTLETFTVIFIFLAIGLAISLIALCVERRVHKRELTNPRNPLPVRKQMKKKRNFRKRKMAF